MVGFQVATCCEILFKPGCTCWSCSYFAVLQSLYFWQSSIGQKNSCLRTVYGLSKGQSYLAEASSKLISRLPCGTAAGMTNRALSF